MAHTIPFTYLIGWSKENLWYYGVRYRDRCDPSDLFTKYFTSSKLVHECMIKYGLPDVIEVRRIFDTRHKALLWEQTVLRRMKVLKDKRWLNQNIRGAIEFDDRIRQLMSEAKKGRTWMHKNGKRMLVRRELITAYQQQGYQLGHLNGMKGKDNPMWGKQHNEDTKKKIGAANSRCTLTDEGRDAKSKFMTDNNPMSKEDIKLKHKQKVKESGTSSKKVVHNGVVYNSVREANKAFPDVKYTTLAYWATKEKHGWSYLDPSRALSR